jgi:hypothetical protein
VLAVLLSLSLSLSGPATAQVLVRTNVIGDDGRRMATAGDADLIAAVGLITCMRNNDLGRPISSRGTGTVVGSRSTVLTAAHVLATNPARFPTNVAFEAGECVFRQYDADGQELAEVGFVRAEFGAFRRNAGLPTEDWAVLRTAAPLPESTKPLNFAEFELGALADKTRLPIAIAAFHADLDYARRRPVLSEGMLFAVDYAGFLRLAHTADIGRMSSGAAIVYRTPGGRGIVVGVQRSAASFGEFNLGVPVSARLFDTLRSLAWGGVPGSGTELASLR